MVQLPKREESENEYPMPEPGVYLIELTGLSEVRPSKFANDKTGIHHPEQEFYFQIKDSEAFPVDEEFIDFQLKVYVRVDTFYDGSGAGSPAKVFLITQAMYGSEFDPDLIYDTEDLIGKRCLGTVAHKVTFDEQGNKKTWANLTSYAPVKKAKPLTAEQKRAELERQLAALEEQPVDETPEDIDDIPF